ncbi:MAG: Lrp/AsnC family transcriptional regulator [Streptomycetaceae bacterium]|nr:Lrp/AsnC family transcriptional regulator [Streptomycetaceae bacterium]
MDRIDRRILAELQRDARQTNTELAQRVNLTESPCLRRVRKLERDGFIERYQAVLDRDKLGFGCQVFVTVTMRTEDRATIAAFERQVTALPHIIEAHRLFGDSDYLLRVAVADVDAYQRFYSQVLTGLPGIENLTSHLTMQRVKENRGLPLTDDPTA